MSSLEWQDSWSVGNLSLDEDHKRLISIIEKFGQGRTRSMDTARIISDLEEYTKYHFTREEKLMEKANIPGLEDHKKSHQAFIEWLRTVRQTFAISREARSVLIETVDDYLQDWLKNHILKTDMGYKGLI
jgi:hemerythrin